MAKFPIKIEKINSSTFQLTNISSSLVKTISFKFSFLPPNHRFHPRFRLMGEKGVRIHLIRADGSFPAGLFSEVVQYITDDLRKKVVMSSDVKEHFYPLTELIKGGVRDDVFSDYFFDKNPVILRDYQFGALESAFENRNCLLNLSTGAGKCLGPKTKLKVRLPKEIVDKYNLKV